MTEERKQEIKSAVTLITEIMKSALIDTELSICVTKQELHFFDTETYLNNGKMVGSSIKLEDLVK